MYKNYLTSVAIRIRVKTL